MMSGHIDTGLVEEMWRSQERFGHRAARLYPLTNQRVRTDRGTGMLWQVIAGEAGVVLESDPQKVVYVPVEHVKPAKSEAG